MITQENSGQSIDEIVNSVGNNLTNVVIPDLIRNPGFTQIGDLDSLVSACGRQVRSEV